MAIDSVAGLGDFLELEIVSEKGDIPLATARIESLAAAIGLGTPQQCSYLELILRADSPG